MSPQQREPGPPPDDAPREAGPRPGQHPTAQRSAGKRSTGTMLVLVLLAAAVMYGLIVLATSLGG